MVINLSQVIGAVFLLAAFGSLVGIIFFGPIMLIVAGAFLLFALLLNKR